MKRGYLRIKRKKCVKSTQGGTLTSASDSVNPESGKENVEPAQNRNFATGSEQVKLAGDVLNQSLEQ
jgi:hypothetical protein